MSGLLLLAPAALAQTPSVDFPDIPLPPVIEGLIGLPQAYTPGRKAHLATIRREAEQVGLPPDIADAVVLVESSYNPGAVGGVGEVGLMQIRPTTAAMLGYKGALAGLFEPETNIRYGVAYLGRAWQLAEGNLCRALMKYRAGHGEERMTPLSVEYCRRVRTHLAVIGSPIGAGGNAVSVSPTTSSTSSVYNASKTALKAVADRETESDTASSIRQAKSTSAKTARVLPPRRPMNELKVTAARRMKVPSAETRSVALMQENAKRKAKIRQMWAAHDARLQSISARLKPETLRISTGI